ncbi:MAG: ParB/RepB/Spo0J family partition protein [Oscillospiraceae bacterium]
MAAKKGGLGKGLEALFTDNAQTEAENASTLRISEIEPNKKQPRKDFDDEALAELADSIRQHGVLQPLLVRPTAHGTYQIVAGERRWRASRMAGLTEVPVVIKDLTDEQSMEYALIENLQREDLNPVEEAKGYRTLTTTHGLTQDEVAGIVGKSRPVVANALRLLALPKEVLEMLENELLSVGHARALLGISEEGLQISLAQKVVLEDLTVRDVERIVKEMHQEQPEKVITRATRDSYFDEVELALKEQLGRKIKIKGSKDKGTIQIEFYNKEDLAEIAYRIAGQKRN